LNGIYFTATYSSGAAEPYAINVPDWGQQKDKGELL